MRLWSQSGREMKDLSEARFSSTPCSTHRHSLCQQSMLPSKLTLVDKITLLFLLWNLLTIIFSAFDLETSLLSILQAKIMCSSICKCIGCKNFEESPERKTLMHLADAAEVRVQQQTAAKTKLSSQISDLLTRPTPALNSGGGKWVSSSQSLFICASDVHF